jgi:hypothetical protein
MKNQIGCLEDPVGLAIQADSCHETISLAMRQHWDQTLLHLIKTKYLINFISMKSRSCGRKWSAR